MELYPALDILEGQCVRLKEGKFDQRTVYSDDPSVIVKSIESSQSKNLHLVDLSGAKNPAKRQVNLIRRLLRESRLRIQYGGGIRSFYDADEMLNLGVDRIVIGSMALMNPKATVEILRVCGSNQITLALDVRIQPSGEIQIATEGWQKLLPFCSEDQGARVESKAISVLNSKFLNWIQFYQDAGIKRILCTDIGKDGLLTGPNFELYENLVKAFPQIEFQASGGVSNLAHIQLLKSLGLHSVIVGKALYEGCFTLQEALSYAC